MTNKLVPEIRFDSFKDKWLTRNLNEIMKFSNGINAPKEAYGQGRKMISVLDILSEEYLTYDNVRNSVSVSEILEQKNKVEFGDLVFVRSSEVLNEVGLSKAYLDNEYALYSGFSIRGKKISEYDPIFVERSLNGISRRQIERKSGGSTRYNVSQEILNSLFINMPTVQEQQKIGEFFKNLDDRIALQQQHITLLKESKQGFLQKMFPKDGERVPEVRFDGFSGEWEVLEIKNIAAETYGGGTPKTSISDYWNGNIPWIQSSDLKTDVLNLVSPTKFISDAGINNSATKLVPENSIAIVTRVGVGKLALVPYPYATSQDFLSLSSLKIDLKFALYSLYLIIKKEVNNLQGTSIKGITKPELLKKKIIIPSNLKEQQKIGEFFKNLDDSIAAHEKELELLQETKKGFLQKMFV
ncbi:restriction endonuclease subunit S [Salisediminibacterium selenitireducens]|uniref:Restriction modification system DNA specificity domain protein n=1 Tax=Bacillus selenitireducens (strain ATCC 700615 / DSM 15326 / MLS10) TaxID=439292 RepID=D6XVX5_BACIE|nr:restriction endonuclease subunit S [Salisediminibacterium selenitireducens]ADH97748.1 restriction modification system DNA specificity domain protein [[Bacillus] selenitireducens MLS10]